MVDRALPEGCVNPMAEDAIIKSIPLAKFPRDLFMVGRTLMLLRGLCHRLNLDIQVPIPIPPFTCSLICDVPSPS